MKEAALPTKVAATVKAAPQATPQPAGPTASALVEVVVPEVIHPAQEPQQHEQHTSPSVLLGACRPSLRFGGQKSRVHSMQVRWASGACATTCIWHEGGSSSAVRYMRRGGGPVFLLPRPFN